MRFLMLLALTALPAFADQPLVKLETLNDNRGWEAVGKLVLGDRGFCTGALIAPQLVLTAAHCLFDKETGARIDPRQIKFLAGWRNNRAEAYRGVKQAVAHPDYVYGADDSLDRVADDVALIELDQPILRRSVQPFGIADTPNSGDTVAVVSYGQDRADNPSLQQQCTVMDKATGILVMTCDVDFGSSGAPVFLMKDGVPLVVSVISAKAEVEGKRVSLGSALQIPLTRLMDALQEADAGRADVSHVQILSGGIGGGAKFVKPLATDTP
jgi:V8-like Glu-specific endopeptidase